MSHQRFRRKFLTFSALTLLLSVLGLTQAHAQTSQTQILQLSNPAPTAKPGQSLTMTTNFNAAPMDKNYVVFMHFVDANGKQAPMSGDYSPTNPTTKWSGAVAYNRTVTIPSTLPNGVYTIRMGLYENVAPYTNRATLNPGAGVTVDSEKRYTVGTLTVGTPNLYTLTITSPTSGATASGSVQIKGMGPGFKNVEVLTSNGTMLARATPDATGAFVATLDSTKLSDGSQTLTIDAWDSAAGQPFTHSAESKLALTVQNAAPAPSPAPNYTLTISSPASGASVSGATQIKGMGPGFKNIEILTASGSLLARATPDAAGNFAAPVDTTKLSNGSQTLTVDAWDSAAGQPFTHSAEKKLSVNVQNAAPAPAPQPTPTPAPAPSYTLTISSPANGATVSGSAQVKGSAPGFLNVEVLASSGTLLGRATPDSSGNFVATVDSTKLSNGSQAVTIDAWDSAPGQPFNHTAEAKLNLNVQNTAPAPAPAPAPGACAAPAGQDPNQWHMVFRDEFDGTSLNTSKWNDHVWYESSNPTKNYAVENGALSIWPQRDASGNFFNRTIDTDGKFETTYGYFEAEAKLPVGRGPWPAFWLYAHPGDARPEIDIMEAYSGGGSSSGWSDSNLHPTNFGMTLHKANADYSYHDVPYSHTSAEFIGPVDFSAAFHKYAAKWDSSGITFYLDGKQIGPKYSDSAGYYNRPMYLLLDLWFGSASGTPDGSTPTGKGNAYIVNYVRAWQSGGGSSCPQ